MTTYAHHHVHLMSHDAMGAAAFYRTMFDAEVVASKGANGLPRANMNLGGQIVLISTVDATTTQTASGPHSCLGLDHIGLAVANLAAAVAELKDRGAQFLVEPRGRIAFVEGPDAVSIELVEVPPTP